ncbi:MAG: InlB B-repeat-containing protein, partial [Clostridia bacterium]|nr:InlB B-repeat-containing protein [Clostridia bacterium]
LYDANPMPYEDATAIAIWEPHTHDIIFVWFDNEGDEHEMTDDSWYGVEFGDTVDETGSEPGEREGWTFTDTWLEATDGLEPGDYEYMPDRDLRFVAQYERNEYEYVIDLDDGEVEDGVEYTASGTYAYEDPIVLPADDKVSKAGFDFDGWAYTNAETDEPASETDAIPAYDLTVTAQWARHTYNIEYIMGGGTPDIPADTAEFEDTIDLPSSPDDFHKLGAEFTGWKCSLDDEVYTDTYDVPALEHDGDTITFEAQWIDIDITISFDSKGGSDVEEKVGKYNREVSAPDEPEKDGYDFSGWYEDEECETTPFAFPNTFPPADIILYAKWTPHKYNVVFLQPDDGATEPVFDNKEAFAYKEVFFDEGTEPPEGYPELMYYTPKGWATATDAEPVDFETWTMPAADKDSDYCFYPVFEKDPITLVIKSNSDADIVKTSDTMPVNGYIYNAGDKLNISKLQAQLEVEGPGELRITPSKGTNVCGTGTKIELVDIFTGDVVEAYYLIVAGDVNGDSVCNANDYSIAEAYRTGAADDWRLKDEDGDTDDQLAENARIRDAYKRAADVADAYGEIDDIDTALIELVNLKVAEFGYDKDSDCITVEGIA